MLNGLDLFSGIGGLSLALRPYVRTVAYCENDRHAQGVLLSRMWSGDLDHAPIADDVRELRGEQMVGLPIDIISGGFPCQDISVAGAGKGLEGERSGLVRHIFRLVGELRPKFVFLENVPAIRTRGADVVTGELSSLGYDCRWITVSAMEVGACHRRERWFLLAMARNGRDTDADCKRVRIKQQRDAGRSKAIQNKAQGKPLNDGPKGRDPNTDGARLEGVWRGSQLARPCVYGGWAAEPSLYRGNHGIQNRVDRVRGLGNAVVPAQAREAFRRLSGIKFH